MKTFIRCLEYYLDLDRPFGFLDWALIVLMAFFLGFAVSFDANAQTKTEIERIIVQSANAHGINPKLALAIAEVESRMNPNAIGKIGEIGLFQLRPEFHQVEGGNVRLQANAAMRYLAHLKRECSQYGDAYFVCFNYGPTRPLKHPRLFPYYKKVSLVMARRMKHEARFNRIAQAD